MRCRRLLLLALLLYVALDFSVPSMPGAFAFESADSVESVQARRSRDVAEAVMLPVPSRHTVLLSKPVEMTGRRASSRPVDRGRPLVRRASRTVSDPPSSSDDSH